MESRLRDIQLTKLNERAKELKCIYRVCEALKDENAELMSIFKEVLEAIPPGYQYPTVCEASIIFEGSTYHSTDFRETPWMQSAELVIDNHVAGEIQVCYTQDVFENAPPFLHDEQRLLNAIADHLSRFIFHRRLKRTLEMNAADTNGIMVDDDGLLAYESDEHWKWRMHAAEKITERMDFDNLGIEAVYLVGSVKTGKAGPGSDIDLLIHFAGTTQQKNILQAWLEGWGNGLSELNFYKTGYRFPGSMVDVHIITEEEIKNRTSFAVMIGAADNSAKLLRSKKQ